jgi:NAD(P)-dependent dehydrogenase (short-subunit alcohol dehydrogenase family)
VAFVTGAGQGIGLSIATALADAGATVALADIDADAVGRAAGELGSRADVAPFELDVRDRDAFAAVAADVEARLGPVSVLVNNAGVVGSAAPHEMTFADWDWVLGINVGGVVNGIQTLLPGMIERGTGGYLVNTASGAGLVGIGGHFLYATSKFAVVGLSESLYLPLAAHGIGVSVLCPGPVATNIIANSEHREPRPREGALDGARTTLEAGMPPDAVGQMVLDAMAEGRLYIHTDDVMEHPIKVRTKLLLDALPSVLGA